MFVLGKFFQASLTYGSKATSVPYSGTYKVLHLFMLPNSRLHIFKTLSETNVLAYFVAPSEVKENEYLALTPEGWVVGHWGPTPQYLHPVCRSLECIYPTSLLWLIF